MRTLLVLLCCIPLLFSCKEDNKSNKQLPIITQKDVQNPMIDYNKKMTALEDQQIDDYLKRRGWDFVKTQTGLRYYIIEEGVGLRPEPGQQVSLEYELSLIRGEKIYSSKDKGPIQFVVDRSEAIGGLHELVKLLKLGSKAKVIVPSYLAYGIPGDDDKIPRKATLIYEIYFKEMAN